MTKSCETCRYYDSREKEPLCRRDPPKVPAFNVIPPPSGYGYCEWKTPQTAWPKVRPDDWCGEWAPNERKYRCCICGKDAQIMMIKESMGRELHEHFCVDCHVNPKSGD